MQLRFDEMYQKEDLQCVHPPFPLEKIWKGHKMLGVVHISLSDWKYGGILLALSSFLEHDSWCKATAVTASWQKAGQS